MQIRSRYFGIGVGFPASSVLLHDEVDRPYLFIDKDNAMKFICSDKMREICSKRGYGQDEMHVVIAEVLSNGKTV